MTAYKARFIRSIREPYVFCNQYRLCCHNSNSCCEKAKAYWFRNKKREREETRKNKLEEKEQNRVLKALKKANLNRKQWDCSLKYEEEIKCNKSRWLSCFHVVTGAVSINTESFQVNKISNLYFCGNFSKNNEN